MRLALGLNGGMNIFNTERREINMVQVTANEAKCLEELRVAGRPSTLRENYWFKVGQAVALQRDIDYANDFLRRTVALEAGQAKGA